MQPDLAVTAELGSLRESLDSVGSCLSALPEDAAKRIGEEILRLLDSGALNVAVFPDGATTGAGDRVIRLRVAVGLDELIASACRAAEVDPAVFHGALL